MIYSFEKLPKPLQDYLTDPRSTNFVFEFLESQNRNSPGLAQKVLDYISDCIYGTISVEEMLFEIKTLCTFNQNTVDDFFAEFLEILGEDGLDILELYSFDTKGEPVQKTEPLVKTTGSEAVSKELPRDPSVVQTKLLQSLEKFNLHVDEKGIIAHEVERYLKGEVFSRDLIPHLTAILDKPLSEINTIVNTLNAEIFKPIQKQIAEEGTLDISYDEDTSLQNFLVTKKSSVPVSKEAPQVKKDLSKISFLPKQLPKEVSQQEKDSLFSDFRTQGGTPSGTSLFSQETPKEKVSILQTDFGSKTIDVMSKTKSQSYTIDPYRENIE